MPTEQTELLVLTQDPMFGGGGAAQTNSFVVGARDLGWEPRVLFEPHPALHGARLTWRRIEALRQLHARRQLAPELVSESPLWVVTTLAAAGSAAARSGRPYTSWVGTTIESELQGRARGMRALHRIAAGSSLPALRRLERETLKRSSRIYATSPSSRRELARVASLPERNVGLLPIPVDTGRFRPADDVTWQTAVEGRRVIFVGRGDDPRKNIGLLLATARLLPDVRFRLVGRAPTTTLPPNVEAVGEVPDPSVELRASGVFVLPSLQEGFGIVAAEALAAGLPIVTTPCGGPEDLVRDSGGGIVAADFSARALAEALEEVFAAPQQLRTSGHAYVQREHSPARFRELLSAALGAPT